VAKFGPSLVIVAMSALAAHPAVAAQLTVETLAVPARLSLAGGRALVPDLLSVSPVLRLAAALPAVLLTLLFYLDQVRALICPYPGLYLSLSSPYLCSSTWTRCALPVHPCRATTTTRCLSTSLTLRCLQNISVRAVNACKLRKGEAYHADLLALALVVGGLSLCGLPWVRPWPSPHPKQPRQPFSTAHLPFHSVPFLAGVRRDGAVAQPRPRPGRSGDHALGPGRRHANIHTHVHALPHQRERPFIPSLLTPLHLFLHPCHRFRQETIDNITETRLTGFVIHGAILGSLLLLPLLAHIPVPVISGIFLYLGRKMMLGNLFLDRIGQVSSRAGAR
jgi:HCO3- transporter family